MNHMFYKKIQNTTFKCFQKKRAKFDHPKPDLPS